MEAWGLSDYYQGRSRSDVVRVGWSPERKVTGVFVSYLVSQGRDSWELDRIPNDRQTLYLM